MMEYYGGGFTSLDGAPAICKNWLKTDVAAYLVSTLWVAFIFVTIYGSFSFFIS